ncbi:MAG: 4Fe-4S binding protein [Oscillospiraceae bacterium]|nr:4Fe-4S binding protein [Oscillospiraceae bacterium]
MKPYLREKKSFAFEDIPEDTCFEAGYLVTVNSGWRSRTPQIDNEKCIGCGQCYLYCPDGVIAMDGKTPVIDYDFCKGCGICAKICPKSAIELR